MTEPEDLEEDLFADLYDGDDAPVKQEPVAQPDPQPDPVDTYIPPEIDTSTNHLDTKNEIDETPIKDEPSYENGYNGDGGQSWNEEQAHDGETNHYDDTQMEQNLPPIGIKEDG